MNGDDSHSGSPDREVTRRDLMKAAGAAGITMGLAGCSIRGASNPKAVQWSAGQDPVDNADKIRKALYNAGLSKDIYVEITRNPGQTAKTQAQYSRWLSANLEKPDMLLMDCGWTIPFIVRDQLLNLSETLPENLLSRIENKYFDASVSTARHPETDDLYGQPLFPDFPTMQYRKDLVKKAGYDPKGENWGSESITWKKFSKVTKNVMEQNSGLSYGYTFQAAPYAGLSCCDFNEFMSSWGGAYFGGRDTLFGPIGERPVTVNRKHVIDSIRMVRTFIHGQNDPHALSGYAGSISPNAVLAWTEEPSRKPFTNGNAVMHRNWPYSIAISGAEDALGKDLGVMPIPYSVTDKQSRYKNIGGPVAALGGWNNVINPNSDNIEEVVEVLKAMSTKSFMLDLFRIIGWIPPTPEVLDTQAARNVPVMGRYIDQLIVAGKNAISRPVTVVWPLQSSLIAQRVNGTYAGEVAPKQAMETLHSELAAIEKYNREGI
jgi:ABC-type glycerol-3-phosphate transport system substrate-binding protein